MTPRLQRIQKIEQDIERSQRICRIIIASILAGCIAFMLASCQTKPKMPDPFDVALESAITKMFDTEGQPKP